MRETALLSHIYARSRGLESRFPWVLVGPGHDCAAVALPAPGHALLKVDQLVEGRHFRADAPIDMVARKAIARAVSDIAASGGSPLAALAAATLPGRYAHADALFDALSRWAIHFGAPLVGGDIASSGDEHGDGRARGSVEPDHRGVVLSITAIGAPHPRRGPVLRSGVCPGDGIYVTGALGGSLDAATGLGRHFTFDPRLAESRWLCDELGHDLHAMMDISDGLGRDAARLGVASGVRIRLEAAAIPRASGVADWRRAASEGEDYELLFAVPSVVQLPAACPVSGTPLTRVGTAEAGAGCLVCDGEAGYDASEMGYEHS